MPYEECKFHGFDLKADTSLQRRFSKSVIMMSIFLKKEK